MYSTLPHFVLGFHGCDEGFGELILSGKERLSPSTNRYDWLGHGIYFWENNPYRAIEYAYQLQKNPERTKGIIKTPFCLGAIVDLGHCLNLLESHSIEIIKQGYDLLCESAKQSNYPIPENRAVKGEPDFLLRYLDCAVIETIHGFNKKNAWREYDSVRAVFTEGNPVYPNSGFKEKNHIQICIRNPNCIKGYFRILSPIDDQPIP